MVRLAPAAMSVTSDVRAPFHMTALPAASYQW